MRYTRYDYKRRNSGGFGKWIILIIILAIVIGVGIFKIFISKGNDTVDMPSNSKDNAIMENSKDVKSYGIIQCGLYSSKESAEAAIAQFPNNYVGFVVEEDGKFKVMAGIFFIDDVEEMMTQLTNLSINNFRIKCDIPQDSMSNKLEGEIIDGYLKIINKLYEKDVKSYNTVEFKNWVNEIIGESKDQSDELKEIVENIKLLPDEYKRENGKESSLFLYKTLIKHRNK